MLIFEINYQQIFLLKYFYFLLNKKYLDFHVKIPLEEMNILLLNLFYDGNLLKLLIILEIVKMEKDHNNKMIFLEKINLI